MKAFLLLPICVIFVSCIPFSCQPPLLTADSYEPNDTPAQATPLTGTLTGTMNEGDAPDVFKFTAIANQKVILNIVPQKGKGLGSALDFDVTVAAPDASVVLTRDRALFGGYSNPASQPLEFIASKTGDYVLTLKGVYIGPADSFCSLGQITYQLSTTITNP